VNRRPTLDSVTSIPHDGSLLPIDANNGHAEPPSGVAIVNGELHIVGAVAGGAPIEVCEVEKAKIGLVHVVVVYASYVIVVYVLQMGGGTWAAEGRWGTLTRKK